MEHKKSYTRNNLKESIWYIVGDVDTRVFKLTDDPDENYLMVHYIKTTLMNSPTFYRAKDTKGKNKKTPSIIDSFEYKYWRDK